MIERCFRPLDDWGKVAADVRGHALPCGHYIPEEAPDLLYSQLIEFFQEE